MCRYGDFCEFAHTNAEVLYHPDLYKTRTCQVCWCGTAHYSWWVGGWVGVCVAVLVCACMCVREFVYRSVCSVYVVCGHLGSSIKCRSCGL